MSPDAPERKPQNPGSAQKVQKSVEKPVSLAPLSLSDAVAGLFAIPDPDATKPKNRKAPSPPKE